MSRAQLTSTVEQNTGGAVAPFVAGKNKIINGDFGVWARGTSISAGPAYTCDRWIMAQDTGTPSYSVSQQSFTPGSAPVAGYESLYFARFQVTAASTATTFFFIQKIENVQTFANQTVTLSLWAKSDSARTMTVKAQQNFGSGGSSTVSTTLGTISVGTTWARYSVTAAIPSIAGKTIGPSSFLEIDLNYPAAVMTNDFWGVQLEAGSVATPFTTATGTVQGELAACQRYYEQSYNPTSAGGAAHITGWATSTTVARFIKYFAVPKRTTPSVNFSSPIGNFKVFDGVTATTASSYTLPGGKPLFYGQDLSSCAGIIVDVTVASGLTQYRPYYLSAEASNVLYIEWSSEL